MHAIRMVIRVKILLTDSYRAHTRDALRACALVCMRGIVRTQTYALVE